MEDGAVTTTAELLALDEEEDFTDEELITIHNHLFKVARANHITLSMKEHNGEEGLPFNLTYVVKNKRAQIKCPYCGSKNTARYLYGMPVMNPAIEEAINKGKLILGGCCLLVTHVNGEFEEINPQRKCNDCGKDFARPPILVSKDREFGEFYYDIVTGISFEIGGFFQGWTKVDIVQEGNGATVFVSITSPEQMVDEQKTITNRKWGNIINELYCNMYLHEWKNDYTDPDVLDGEQWSLEIRFTNGRKKQYTGSNAYPPYWKELCKIFKEYAKF